MRNFIILVPFRPLNLEFFDDPSITHKDEYYAQKKKKLDGK